MKSKLDKLEEVIDKIPTRSAQIAESLKNDEEALKNMQAKLDKEKEKEVKAEPKTETSKTSPKAAPKESPKQNLKSSLIKRVKKNRISVTYYLYKYLDDRIQELVDHENEIINQESDDDSKLLTKGQVLEFILEDYFSKLKNND